MNWTLEDNMIDGLFCATQTGRRGGHTPFVQAGAETPDTGAEAIKPDLGSSWDGHSGEVGAGVRDENAESCGGGVVRSLRIPLVICPVRRTYVVRHNGVNIATLHMANNTTFRQQGRQKVPAPTFTNFLETWTFLQPRARYSADNHTSSN